MALQKRLKICMVSTFYPPYHFGGDAVYAYRLAEALAGRGHRVDVIHSLDAYHLSHPADPEVSFTHHPNVTLHSLATVAPRAAALLSHQLGRPGFYAKQLKAIFAQNQYDVIHYHNVSLMGAPGLLRLGNAVKLYTTHEYWLICPTHVLFTFDREACVEKKCLRCTLHSRRPPQWWRGTGMLRRALRHVDCIITPSRFAMQRHQAEGIDRPIVHIPHFVPEPTAAEVAGRAVVHPRPFFLYVGRLEKLKGVQDLLRIFRNYREADLLIVGTGGYEQTLREQARDLQHVKCLGKLHPGALANLYQQAIAVLVPSLCYETFGLTAAEALMHGTPAIVRRIGALTEIIEQSGGGFSFSNDAECVAAMEQLRTQPELRSKLALAGQDAARQLWSVGAHLERYEQLVASLLAKRKDAVGNAADARGQGAATASIVH